MESTSSKEFAKELLDYVNKSNVNFKQNRKTESKAFKNKNRDTFLSDTFQPTPIPHITLLDIKITDRGRHINLEDKLYLENDSLFHMIRRGNTIIQNTQTKEIHIARVGLKKFYDYKKTYNKNDLTEQQMERRVLDPVKSSTHPLSVYLTEKANGENCQITYCGAFQCWIISSKNVSIAVRNENDIEWYETQASPKERYVFCIEFAKVWFDIVTNRIKDKIEEFKIEMNNYTLICESVGDLNRQHIKLYNKRDFLFYAIVNHLTLPEETCISLQKAFELFKKYNLSYVPVEPSEKFNTYNELKCYLDKQYDEIMLRTVDNGGEGCVVYFVENCENGNERILGLAKLKTFEYRMYRKLREKSKGITTEHAPSKDVLMGKIRKESLDILEGNESKLNFEEYMKFASFYFDFALMDKEHKYMNVFAELIEDIKIRFKSGKEINIEFVDKIRNKYNEKLNFAKLEEDNKRIDALKQKQENIQHIQPKKNNNKHKNKKKHKKGKTHKDEDDDKNDLNNNNNNINRSRESSEEDLDIDI